MAWAGWPGPPGAVAGCEIAMGYRFNPPPNWPAPPPGWFPPPGWRPAVEWPAPPPGWQLWVDDGAVPAPAPVVPPRSSLGQDALPASVGGRHRAEVPAGPAQVAGEDGEQ